MSEPTTLPEGTVIDGRYRIESVLGIGGLGVVYRARHVGLDRAIALKMLHPEIGHVDEVQKRFAREARALSTLVHPHIVQISDFGESEGLPYLAMKLLEGKSLADVLETGTPSPEDAIEITVQTLRALAHAHAHGVLHRDIKPGNVFLEEVPGEPLHVQILDFGLAKMGDPGGDAPPAATLTRLGTILGTPSYMSPEQAASSAADARSDLYSVGVVLYEMLTGRRPFEEDNRLATIRAHLAKPVPDPETLREGLTLSAELRELFARSLAKTREERYASADEMLAAVLALPHPAARIAGEPAKAAAGTRPDPSSNAETVVVSKVPTKPPPAKRGAAQKKGPPKRARSPARVFLAGLSVVAAAVLTAVAVFLVVRGGWGEPAAATAPAGPDDRASTTPEGAGATEPAVPRPPPVDRLSAVPRGLRALHTRVRRGRELTDAQQRALRQYQQEHPEDATASLILAHDHVRRVWLTAALERYGLAFRLDPAARGTPWMQGDLLAVAMTGSHGRAAADLIAEIYGAEIVSAIDQVLATGQLDDASRVRLERLRERVSAL